MADANGRSLAVGQTIEMPIESQGKKYNRILVKTHFVTDGEDLGQVIRSYLGTLLKPGDWVVISEKCAATARGLAVDESTIKPGWWARLLYKFVRHTRHGRGIGTPEKMQVAIELAGLWRILLATLVSAITRPFGFKGWFYRVAGDKVRSIDGQSGGPDGPYWTKVILPLPDANLVAQELAVACEHPVVVADINDLGGSIKGWSHQEQLNGIDFADIFRDNPMGQGDVRTPLAVVRSVAGD